MGEMTNVNVYFTKSDDSSKVALKNLAFSSNAYAKAQQTQFKMQTDPAKKDKADIKPTGEYVVVKDKTIMDMAVELAPGAEDSEKVKILQGALQMQGYEDLAVDGDFGPATEKAVKQFQESLKGFKPPVMGKVDKKTWEALGQFKIQKALAERDFKTWYPTGEKTPFNKALNKEISEATPAGTITPKAATDGKGTTSAASTAPKLTLAPKGTAELALAGDGEVVPTAGAVIKIDDITGAEGYNTDSTTFEKKGNDLVMTFNKKTYTFKEVFDPTAASETDLAKAALSKTAPGFIQFKSTQQITFETLIKGKAAPIFYDGTTEATYTNVKLGTVTLLGVANSKAYNDLIKSPDYKIEREAGTQNAKITFGSGKSLTITPLFKAGTTDTTLSDTAMKSVFLADGTEIPMADFIAKKEIK